MNWFIKLSQLQPFLKSLGLSDESIQFISSIDVKPVRLKIIELVQNKELEEEIIPDFTGLLIHNYNMLIHIEDNPHYRKWLIKNYLNNPKVEEDLEIIKNTLQRLKQSNIDKNINNYQDIPDIARALDNTKNKINKRNKGGELLNLPDGAELLGTTENGLTVVKITTVPAANLLADGTQWCVKNEGPAKHYLDQGPLYLFYKNNERYALLHNNDGDIQLMNIYDQPLIGKAKWDVIKNASKFIGVSIEKTPELAFDYAEYIQREFPEGEDAIATSGHYSHQYAMHVTHKRFIKGEREILKLDEQSLFGYIFKFFKGGWKEAEPKIAQSSHFSVQYAAFILKGRFPLGEPKIAESAAESFAYAEKLKRRFPLGEPTIASSAQYSYNYAFYVLKDRFLLGEEVISKSPYNAIEYAQFIIKGEWKKAEPFIAKNADCAYHYAIKIIKKRFIPGEPEIKKKSFLWTSYKKNFNMEEFA